MMAGSVLRNRGAVLIISMIFIAAFSVLTIGIAALSDTQLQTSHNQYLVSSALCAAQSGLDCAVHAVRALTLPETNSNTISQDQAEQAWNSLASYLSANAIDSGTVANEHDLIDPLGDPYDRLSVIGMQVVQNGPLFSIQFVRYPDPNRYTTIEVTASGTKGSVTRNITISFDITKDNDILCYAIASHGRMWLTGDTTIYGNIFSSWDRADISPFNMTSDSSVFGTVNTVLTLNEIEQKGAFQLEKLNCDDQPLFYFGQTVFDENGDVVPSCYGTIDENNDLVDHDGNPVFDAYGYRIPVDFSKRLHDSCDELQGYHENVEYYDPAKHSKDMPGLDIHDYDTSYYYNLTCSNNIPSSTTLNTEYFPHKAGNYGYPRDGRPGRTSNQTLNRHVYENETFEDARLPEGRHALFKNCTFNGILYLDVSRSSTSLSATNNVRFENCTFNGVIVTDVPTTFNWMRNCLYFTDEATFNNQSNFQEATILAPHFNVNLGNTNPQQSDNNILTGAIVGGIVDVRGNAQIYGTIISMCDTTGWSSGYVTNIGATLDDGGSETTELGDIGTIEITPDVDQLLPPGITSPMIIDPNFLTYYEY